MGHPVYTSRYDPRAAIARKYLEKIMEREDTQKLPSDERALFAVATELEDIALNDEYFVSRNLYPNVDFYTGLIYRRSASIRPCSPRCSRWAAFPVGCAVP